MVDFRCPKDGTVTTVMRTALGEYPAPRCKCGELMQRVWTPPAIRFNWKYGR